MHVLGIRYANSSSQYGFLPGAMIKAFTKAEHARDGALPLADTAASKATLPFLRGYSNWHVPP